MLYRISQVIVRLLMRFYFRVRLKGQEYIPQEGACIIVANHTSFLDPFLICATIPRVVHFLTFAYFYHLPYCSWYCKRVHCVPIRRDGKDVSALKTVLCLLKRGEFVGIFPEGRRSETGQIGKGELGVALMALHARAPILPVGICGAYKAFPRGVRFPKPTPMLLTFGKPFRIEDHINLSDPQDAEFQQRTLDLIMSKIAELCVLPGEFSPKIPVGMK